MKRIIIASLFTLSIFVSLTSNAKIWRVNNKSNYNASSLWGDNFGGTAAYPVFKQINQAAINGTTVAGDTIHVEGSTETYDGLTINKRLVILGTGFYLTDNPATSNNTLQSNVKYIDFNTGSTGSFVSGINFIYEGSSFDAMVYINTNNITIKRCRIEKSIELGFPLSDVYVLQNFFPSTYATNVIVTNGSSLFIPPTDLIFNNNICQKSFKWGTPINNPTTLWPVLQCNNNIFDGPDNLATPSLAFSTSEFRNNILMATNAVTNIAASSGVITHNIGTLSTQFGLTNNNLVVPGITALFVVSTSTDGKYQIAAGSQANNNGSDATDRGAFGGSAVTSRYTLSGMPPIPVIYEITTTGVATPTGLPVLIKARTIK